MIRDLYFSGLPHFISKPSPTITVKETQNVLIPCKANGFPQPVITWYKNGHLMEKERKYFGERSLKFKKVQFQDRGVYTCTAESLLVRVELSVNVSVKGISVCGTHDNLYSFQCFPQFNHFM